MLKGEQVRDFEYVDNLPDDHPDLLENCGMPRSQVQHLRKLGYSCLSDFDDQPDADILRQPNINRRVLIAIRQAQASRTRSFAG